MLVWRSGQSNLCGLRIICHSERSEESHIEHREFDSRRDGRPVRPRAIRESPLQKWQKFVILSAAKNLLLCEFLLTEILRYAQDDTSGRAVHAPTGVAVHRWGCIKINRARAQRASAPTGVAFHLRACVPPSGGFDFSTLRFVQFRRYLFFFILPQFPEKIRQNGGALRFHHAAFVLRLVCKRIVKHTQNAFDRAVFRIGEPRWNY